MCIYKDQELAVVAALRTVYFMAKKNLPNDNFSDFFYAFFGVAGKYGYR